MDDSDDRKHMTGREVLEKYIDLVNTFLTEREKKEVRDMLYQYRVAFSLRDDIGTCPNIEVVLCKIVQGQDPFMPCQII